MRISDWSSDVCSSDLTTDLPSKLWTAVVGTRIAPLPPLPVSWTAAVTGSPTRHSPPRLSSVASAGTSRVCGSSAGDTKVTRRSEEHTSELQSLMRTSYAVFCLKKNKTEKLQNSIP